MAAPDKRLNSRGQQRCRLFDYASSTRAASISGRRGHQNPGATLRTFDDDDTNHLFILERAGFGALIEALSDAEYEVIAPTIRDGAIIYDAIISEVDLPSGWADDQQAGRYKLKRRNDEALFGYAVGPHSWKKYLHPPEQLLWRAKKKEGGFDIHAAPIDTRKRAFLGVRACEIAAIEIQDRVFLRGPHIDEAYRARRENTLIIAVNCGDPAATCFCVSMSTGPAVRSGYDIAITEIISEDRHHFVIDAAGDAGRTVLKHLPLRPAGKKGLQAAEAVTAHAQQQMKRSLDTDGLQALLQNNADHPQWDNVASRCLSCTNCTAVCPTCFCTTVEDHTDLSGENAERVQHWDSCFSGSFSELGGAPVRRSTKSRYRQWMTHKLSTWIDQFGTSGCVGCGRCIAWCPAGIDITEEAAAIRKGANS